MNDKLCICSSPVRDRYNDVTSDESVIHTYTHKQKLITNYSMCAHSRYSMPILSVLSVERVENKGKGREIEPRRSNCGSYHTLPSSHSSTDKEGKGYVCKGSYGAGKGEKQVL